MAIDFEPYRQQLEQLGLNAAEVHRHGAKLLQAVTQDNKPCFKIFDTCRLDNGGVITSQALTNAAASREMRPVAKGFVAFVPAAGAASRYSQPLTQVITALEASDNQAFTAGLAALAAAGAKRWPLPERVLELLDHPEAAADLTEQERIRLLVDLQFPKALFPAVREGASFLELKHREHLRLAGLDGQVFIAPAGMKAVFAKLMQELMVGGHDDRVLTTSFLEQGPNLSTIRFQMDGKPYTDAEGQVTPVPAGHGTLAQLFPEVRRTFPAAHSLFIRNIDNVMGTSAPVLAATASFLTTHRMILDAVVQVRAALDRGDLASAAEVAAPLVAIVAGLPDAPFAKDNGSAGDANSSDPASRLRAVQSRLFHTILPRGTDAAASLAQLRQAYARPVNTLGQVPNTGKDVGGTPCFVHTQDGIRKVCIEVPHVSPEDLQSFLANPAKATHFNPVFACAEITSDADWYNRTTEFWLLSAKTYRGEKVMYYETVLYELLGNSSLANCAFVEIPRIVFNPHKALQDAAERTLADWISG